MKTLMQARDLKDILVVDDNPENLHLLSDILKKYDYKVRPVPNGKLAISAATINPPDLILLDIMMPDIDGYQVCKQLKSNPETKDIPVIFLSAMDESVDKVKAFVVGGADYITKPFQVHEVLIRVKNQLAVYSLQRKLKLKNEKLNQTIERLKQNQKKLIKAEKYLVLDKIISGIANQVNSPLVEIENSFQEIDRFTESKIEDLPVFLQTISPQQQKYFAAILKQATQNKVALSESEEQELKSTIIEQLAPLQLDDAEQVADMFIFLGCQDDIENFLPLLTEKNYLGILENACIVHNLHHSIQKITESTTKFKEIFAAFSNYSNYQRNEPKRQTNIKDTIEKAFDAIGEINPEITVIKNYSNIPPVYCYPQSLQKVWTNIIQNALDAIGDRGMLIVNLDLKQNNIVVDIADSGMGIEKELVRQLCDPFFTTKSAEKSVGLGLTIVKQIVEKHEGTISVKSLPGQTNFTVALPLV